MERMGVGGGKWERERGEKRKIKKKNNTNKN